MENKVLKLRRKKEKAYSECNYDQLYGFCVDLAQIFLENEDYDNALKEFREAEQAGEMANMTIYVAKAKRMIGEVYVLIEKPKEAIKHVLKYLELSKAHGDLKEEQRALATLARTYFVLAESSSSSSERGLALKEAEDYNNKSLLICDRLKEITNHKDVAVMKARVYLNLGLVMEAQDCSDKAIEYLEKAVCIGRNLDLWEELSLSYTNLGIAYKHRNDTAKSLKAFDLGLAAASRLSDKAKSVCDILLLKAGVLFNLPDFRGAKHTLHRAYKMRTPDDDEHQEIARKLKIVAAVCKLENRLLYMDEENLLEKRKIYESMGDGCAEMESYEKALEYYHLTLKCAEELGESGKKLADIYVSLAQTYRDLKQFDKALDYYYLEYHIWKNNAAEACRTSLSIAEVLENKGAPINEVFTTYKSAQSHAKDAKNMKLERLVLKELTRYLKEVKDDAKLASIEDELKVIESKLGDGTSDESDSDNDANENTNTSGGIGDEICLDTLTDSELDEEEQSNSKPRSSRRNQKPFHFRRNEKGETPLHTACINGNLALVQRLLDQGHPVDVRDNNGWLPLHEAANFGYLDIVRELLERGAAINDRGGPSCGGITPLLDAASCGHLEVMELLLEKGASPTVRSNKGETVLDCLRGWRRRFKSEEKRELDSETLRDFHVMVHKIKTAMEKAGHITSKKSEISEELADSCDTNYKGTSQHEHVQRSPEALRNKSVSRTNIKPLHKGFSETKSELRRSIDSEFADCSSTSHSSNKRYSDEAVTEYEKAIRGLKHRVVRMEVPVSPLKESQDALLEPDSRTDDWLIDDIGDSRTSRPTKRRRKNEEFIGQQLRVHRDSSSETIKQRPSKSLISSSFNSDSETSDDMPQYYPRIDAEFGEVTSSFPEITRNEAFETVDDIEELPGSNNRTKVYQSLANSSTVKTRKHQTTLISTGISCQKIQSVRQQDHGLSNESESVPPPALIDAACSRPNTQMLGNRQRTVKVLVEGKLLLIVLPNEHEHLTISWLAEEAARRYKSMEGLEPVLNLQTVEGALLFLQDPLSLIFDVGSEIHATVTSWNLTPITQRYKDACSAANTTVISLVETQLDACQATTCLDVENFGLSSTELVPVFKALAHHHALQHLRLSGNVLGDSGLKALVDTIIRLPQLRELDISCNNITSDGCSYMAHHISQNGGFQSLETLNVSFNHLGDDFLRSLCTLLSVIPALHTLRMSSVWLTSIKATIDLPLENIEVLDVSYNQIGQEGARSFLSRLNPDRVCSLNFSAVGKYVGREIAIFLSQSVPHNLVDLNVAYCDVEDADMVPLIECLRSCPQLQKLNLAGNSHLSVAITQQLMQLSLTDLNLAGVYSYMPLASSISNLCISSNTGATTGNNAPFSVVTNNLKSIMSVH